MEVIDRVQKLIALALNNPNAEESRSAALAAVRMIDEHKLFTHQPTAASRFPPQPGAAQQQNDYNDILSQMGKTYGYTSQWDEHRRAYEKWAAAYNVKPGR